jgi:hypothetical protein
MRTPLGGGQPVALAGGLGQLAVQADQPGSREAGGDARLELRRQVDLGHQHQRLPALRQHVGDQAQVDLGLAAAGDAEQQEGLEAFAGLAHGGEHGCLLVGERRFG